MASVAIEDGLLIAVDSPGVVHCLDAVTGKVHWTHDLLTAVYAPPLIVDGKAYLADWNGDVTIFALSKEKRLIATHYLGDSVYCAPVFANGVLYLAIRDKLVAVVSEEPASTEAAAAGGHWPQWRGPNRDNVSTETGLLQQWPEEGPPLAWRVEGLGQGIASVSIADCQIHMMTYANVIEFIVALDQATGNLRWAAPVGPSIGESRLLR